MANQFLVDIHGYLSMQIAAADEAASEAQILGDQGRQQFYAGKLDELQKLRAFISDKFNLITQKYY